MTEETRGVYVSTSQLYEEVRRVADALIRLETKLESTLDQVAAADVEMTKRLDDHETRLRALEERRFPHGALSVTAALLGAVAVVWQAVGGH